MSDTAFVAVVTKVLRTGQYEDVDVDVETIVVSARSRRPDVEGDLLRWLRAQGTVAGVDTPEVRITVTEVDLISGHVGNTWNYRVEPTITLVTAEG